MSSVERYLFILFVLFNHFEDSLIRCQMNVRYTHAINDCFHLCFGVRVCIEDCEQGYRGRLDNRDPYDWNRRNRQNRRKSITNYDGDDTTDDNTPKKSLAQSLNESQPKSRSVSSFRISNVAQPEHCGLRYRSGGRRMARMPLMGAFGMGRIVGGEDAEPNEFPWLVSLQITKQGLPNKHFCGAAIINEYYILTAAHCTESLVGKESQIIIKAGVNSPDEEDGQIVRPAKFIIHEGWDVERQINDISLIRLMNPIRYRTNNLGQYTINAICLPREYYDPKGSAQLAGWGQLTEDDKSSADWLQKITLPIWDRQKCRVNYKEYMQILKTHICAGGRGGHDSCMGDSGGPLMYTKGDRTVILGVVSFGIPCAIAGLPGVYTHLAYYMDWISYNMI